MRRLAVLFLLTSIPPALAAAQQMPPDYAAVLETLGRKGDFAENVLRIGVPRDDLTVSIDGVAVPSALGFGGWVALTPGDHGMHVLMGDLVLTEREVNPVISAVLEAGLDVTALHNHFFYEAPRIFYVHVHGAGTPAALAEKIRPALALIGRAPAARQQTGARALASGPLDTKALSSILGHAGETNGEVYKVTIGRPDLDLREHGARIGTRMGLNTWAAFAGSNEDAVVAGDVAMLANEVTAVLKALRSHGLEAVALHHHMTTTGSPAVYFVHHWGRGAAADLARGVRAALDVLP